MPQRERADHGLERARRPERMTGRTLGGAYLHGLPAVGEHRRDGVTFGAVVTRGAGAVHVDVVDVRGGETGVIERLEHRCACASSLRMR